METSSFTRIIFHQSRASSSYSEQETLAVSHLDQSALRHLRAIGLVEGQETDGERRYSEEDVVQLRRIRRLQHDLGVNLAGVEVILHLLQHLEALLQELEQGRKRLNLEHFTEKAREALNEAAQLATQHHHSQVECEHLLAALLNQEGGVVQQVIAKVGGDLEAARRTADDELDRLPKI